MTNDAFIDVLMMGLDSDAIAIVEFQLQSVGDMGDQLAIRLRSMRSSSNLFLLWTETNQRSISALEDLSALHGALWRSHRAPQSAA